LERVRYCTATCRAPLWAACSPALGPPSWLSLLTNPVPPRQCNRKPRAACHVHPSATCEKREGRSRFPFGGPGQAAYCLLVRQCGRNSTGGTPGVQSAVPAGPRRPLCPDPGAPSVWPQDRPLPFLDAPAARLSLLIALSTASQVFQQDKGPRLFPISLAPAPQPLCHPRGQSLQNKRPKAEVF